MPRRFTKILYKEAQRFFERPGLVFDQRGFRNNFLRPQIATLKTGRGQHSKYLPYAFTEHGVAMLSGVLNGDKAISMNIAIMRAFVQMKKALLKQNDLKEQLKEIKDRLGSMMYN